MRNVVTATSAAALLVAIGSMAVSQTREEISIVGSSTVFPYTQAVSEQFSASTGAPSPVVESTGTGGGMQVFCGGIGAQFPDLTGASRAMRSSEYELCQQNGVEDITEALIGFDGLTMSVSRDTQHEWDLTLAEIYQGLGAQIAVDGEWVDNPNTRWSDIDPELPDVEILVYGPPPTSGTRDAFVELAMHAGCEQLEYVETLEVEDKGDWVEQNCSRMRTDGPFVEAGENDNLIVQRLQADPSALGIFGYSFLFENQDTLMPVAVDGVEPTTETIADKSYPISRPLYFYVKNAHRGVIPNLQEFIEEYMSDDALAQGGYLTERGLVSLAEDRLESTQDAVIDGEGMSTPEN